MGTITEFRGSRRGRVPTAGRFVTCAHCGERHPIVKLGDGSFECITGFSADGRWFCRNRGCHAAWLGREQPRK